MNETVFVVDDDEAMRDSLVNLLESTGYRVEPYADGESFLAAYTPQRAGCVLLDLAMPGMNGVEVHEELRRREAALAVIFLTGHGSVDTAVEAVKNGALDFLEKPVAGHELLRQVREALQLAQRRREDQQASEQIQACYRQLSPREKQVMAGIVHGASNKEIARELGLSPRTVEVHRKSVMNKMRANSLAELIRMATNCPMDTPAAPDNR